MAITGIKGIRQIGPPDTPPEKRVLGLTGNPGAGKSTVAGLMKEFGVKVISADEVGHEMLTKQSPIFSRLIQEFGESILNRDGEIDRRILGQIVFESPDRLTALNSIVHPAIVARIEDRIASFRQSDEAGPLVIDAALIYEWNVADRFDGVIAVIASPPLRKKRFLEMRGESGMNFDQREAAQLPESDKKQFADTAIHNNESIDQLRSTIKEWMEN